MNFDTSRRVIGGITAIALGAFVAGDRAEAATFDLFLIAEQTVSGNTATTTSVYELFNIGTTGFAGSARGATDFSYSLGAGLDVEGFTDPSLGEGIEQLIDENDGLTGPLTTTYLQSESTALDNDGDAEDRIDLGRNSTVTFSTGTSGITDLILADIGGLSGFGLDFCPDGDCTSATRLFSGMTSNLINLLKSQSDITTDDTATEVDQTFLFRFDSALAGSFRLIEQGRRSDYDFNERFQADYVGGVSPVIVEPPAMVPGPASLPLMAGGLGLLVWLRRRKTV